MPAETEGGRKGGRKEGRERLVVETGSQDDGEIQRGRKVEEQRGMRGRRLEYREGLGNGDYKAEII